MERRVAKFSGHEEAEKSNREYYHRLSPQQRLHILLELIDRARDPKDESSQRVERVYRKAKLAEG